MIQKVGKLIIKFIFALFTIFTSFYCLLAYPPFTYQQVIKLELITWLPIFAKFHPYIYLLVNLLITPIMLLSWKTVRMKKLVIGFIIVNISFNILLIFYPLLASLTNSPTSLVWSFVTILPLCWLIIIDHLEYFNKVVWLNNEDNREIKIVFWSLLKTAIFTTLLYFVIAHMRQASSDISITIYQAISILTLSFSTHLVMFMLLFIIVTLTAAINSLIFHSSKVEFWLIQLIVVILTMLVFKNLIFVSISFNNIFATLFAFIFAAILVTFCSSISLQLATKQPAKSPLSILLLFCTYKSNLNKKTQLCLLIVLALTTYLLTIKFVALDWNFLFQKLIAIIVWLFTFSIFYQSSANIQSKAPNINLMLCFTLLSLISYKSLTILQNSITYQQNDQTHTAKQLLTKYTGYDVSLKLLVDTFIPIERDSLFYHFLQQNSNIAQEIKVKPVDINFVNNLTINEEQKPHIFIFTIDSLRQDYVGAYNGLATFTPNIDTFAKQSIVMENAFTRYGATGLSEPSIWVGGLVLHKQYTTPFYSMNSLQKLIEMDNYQSFISLDSILETIVKPSPNIIPLDKGISTQSLDFCRTMTELKEKIVNRTDKNRPIFVYTQPQNIHISVINREDRTILDNDSYAKFYAPYASRLKRIDKCFGDFIDFLKTQKLFDNSIIIFTADHGDSLGEEGRFGHAYTIFPEILRVPLIIHLPNRFMSSVIWNTKDIAFTADITPSLYYLLEHKPIIKQEILGRPLFTNTLSEQRSYLKDSYLVASSYGAVYGILSNNGQSLYIADGVNFQDYFYDLSHDPQATTNLVNPTIKRENERLIRQYIESISQFYQFKP